MGSVGLERRCSRSVGTADGTELGDIGAIDWRLQKPGFAFCLVEGDDLGGFRLSGWPNPLAFNSME